MGSVGPLRMHEGRELGHRSWKARKQVESESLSCSFFSCFSGVSSRLGVGGGGVGWGGSQIYGLRRDVGLLTDRCVDDMD